VYYTSRFTRVNPPLQFCKNDQTAPLDKTVGKNSTFMWPENQDAKSLRARLPRPIPAL
jgi:hypothetical protein